MADFKVRYKNHCTPQEYVTENTRWYLASDIKAKLTGTYLHTPSTQPVYTSSAVLAASGSGPVTIASSKTFVYVKNIGDAGAVISISGNYSDAYRIKIDSGESFTSMIDTTAVVVAKSSSGTATEIEYLTAVG